MDQKERIGNFEEGIRAALKGFQADLWTALPGIAQVNPNTGLCFDPAKMTVAVQPTIKAYVLSSKGVQTWVALPLLIDVPVVFPCAGGFALTLPIQPGDEVLVIFASRCMDAWWQNGGVGIQAELRMHDKSDGFAIPGVRSKPNVLPNVSMATAQLRNLAGTAYIELEAGGVVNIVAPGGVNITGALNVDGDVDVTGTVDATEEGTFNGGHTVSAHKHGGVQTGSGTTGTPTG